jgi:hypothetical protein
MGLFERRLSAEQRGFLAAARGRLRSSQLVYGDLERWLLVAVAQRFGLAFNLGALATCLYLIAFSDLAFAWQTTLDWTSEGFHRAIALLAAPWSWIYPDGVPSLDVVRASRYFRLDGGVLAGRPELLGEWWRFLVLCLLVYGLLPRALIALLAATRLRRALGALRLDHAELASLFERLAAPLVETHAATPEEAPPARGAPAAVPAPAPREGDARAVIWGDVPVDDARVVALVARRFGWKVLAVERAGTDETRRDAAAIAAVAGGDGPIVVLAEAFEAPTREARGFVGALRAAAGAQRSIVVALLDGDDPPASDDLAVWRRHIAALGDPYLRVEALVERERP